MKSRRIKWPVHVASMGGMRRAYKITVENREGKITWVTSAHVGG